MTRKTVITNIQSQTPANNPEYSSLTEGAAAEPATEPTSADRWFHEPIHRGEDFMVFNKPSGISVLKDRQSPGCLWDDLKRLLPAGTRPYMVHRLDKGTSGVWVVATSQSRQRQLTKAFEAHDVRKYYVARVTRAAKFTGTGLIDLPLTKGRKSRYRIAGNRDAIKRTGACWTLGSDRAFPGAKSKTAFESSTRFRRLDNSTLLLQPLTGRTHQLRVHLAWTGSPIKGDHLYGKPDDPKQRWPRLALHCHRLVINHVGTFRASAPQGFLT